MIPELVCRKRSATYVRTRCAEPAPFTQGAFLFGAMQSFFAEGGLNLLGLVSETLLTK